MFGINLVEAIIYTIVGLAALSLLIILTRGIYIWYTGNNEIIELLKEIRDQNKRR